MVVARFSLASCVFVAVGLLAAAPASADRASADQRHADEQEMLARAREEAHDQRRPQRLQGTVTGANVGNAAESAAHAEALKREAELQRLSDKLRRAHMGRTRTTAPVETPWTTEVTRAFPDQPTEKPFHPEQRSALGHAGAASKAPLEERATVLLVMTPGSKGIRRFEKTADPILCSNDGCYISNGAETAARYISLRRSFGVLNTFGPRAGACRQSTTCVFRGVDVSQPNAIVQPVDLKVLVHDRRAIVNARVDETCRVDAGRLACNQPLRGADFVMWIVPESVASRAGAAALRFALDEGLESSRRASAR